MPIPEPARAPSASPIPPAPAPPQFQTASHRTTFAPKVVLPALLVLGILLVFCGFYPQRAERFFSGAQGWVVGHFDWFYTVVVTVFLVFLVLIASSRYGDIRLGADDAVPDFSFVSWTAMLFAAGMGIGLVFWGVAEPISHYGVPPPGIAANTPEAANAAMRYSFFHWGLHPWAVYSIVALAIAFFQFRKGGSALVSTAVESLPWAPLKKLGPVVNVLAVIATAFGVAASLGMGALQINSGLNSLLGLPVGDASQVGIIVVTTLLFLASAVTGVTKGIKWLSNINLTLAALLTLAVFVMGPTVTIIDT